MRPIKFRGWIIPFNDTPYMEEDLYDDCSQAYKDCNCSDFGEIINDERCTPMQFTGLTDKNGKEIYEGDIIKVDGTKEYENCVPKPTSDEMIGIFEVETELTPRGYITHWKSISGYPCSTHIMGEMCEDGTMETIEVIGNIYENPELLTNNLGA